MGLLYNSIFLNSVSVSRILELDFALIIGIGGILIGITEGFSLLAISRGFRQGREVRRDGMIADARMKPSKRIRAWRLSLLFIWMFTFWSKLSWIF